MVRQGGSRFEEEWLRIGTNTLLLPKKKKNNYRLCFLLAETMYQKTLKILSRVSSYLDLLLYDRLPSGGQESVHIKEEQRLWDY